MVIHSPDIQGAGGSNPSTGGGGEEKEQCQTPTLAKMVKAGGLLTKV